MPALTISVRCAFITASFLFSIHVSVHCTFLEPQSGEIFIAIYLPDEMKGAAHRNIKL